VLPPAGSLEIWTREVARRLAERHEVTIYASASAGTEDGRHDGVDYRYVGHRADARLARLLRPLWRLQPADKAFFSSLAHPFLYWLRVALDIRRRGIEVVHVYNYSQALPIIRRLNPRVTIALHMQCEWLAQLDQRMIDRRLAHADVVIGCSEHITGAIRRRFPRHAHRCRIVYNGVDIGAPPQRDDGDGRDGTVTLLHVGRISPEKGHHLLVEALNEVVPDHPELRMVFVGEESLIPADMAVAISPDPVVRALGRFYDGSYLEQVQGLMSPELAERTVFAGRVDHELTAGHYADADLFVFPSIFEAFPIPPIEAMATGLPVVAARAGGAVESVVDGETGVLVDRDDPRALAQAIRELAADPARRAALGAAGHERARDVFSWPSVTEELERVLTDPDGDVATAYDAWHRAADVGEDPIDAPWHTMAIPQLPPLDGARVLEIGCGRGGFSKYLAERGADLVAADFSDAAVAITDRMLAPYPNAEAVVADIEALPYETGSFDAVVSLDTIEHVPDPTRAVAELVRVLKPGGRFVLTTNNYLGLIGLWRLAMKLTGFRYTEEGQPINQPLMHFPSAKLMRGLGCDVELIDGRGHYLRVPKAPQGYVRLGFLERPHALTKWFGTHRVVVATKR
jgi:glycosyltransferase involved in cell wall biosynthesis/protein-L-isoaspartate O-methyltransferase